MAAKLIPAAVLAQCIALTVDQVQAAMEQGGADAKLTSAEFLGMMPGGAFVYACTGESFRRKWKESFEYELIPQEFPDYLATFKVKLAYAPKLSEGFKPEATEAIARAKRRQLAEGWAVHWG